MTRYPEVQGKVQEELNRVVGHHRAPNLQDKSNLHYTEAVLMEIQRYANILPLGLVHICHRDFTVNGFTIPSDTRIHALFTEIHKGTHWGDGTVFRPDRFLDSEGKCKKDNHLMPFSIGKRQCLGEALAKAELFLFFTGLLHQFSFWPEEEGKPPSEDYNNGLTVLPKPFRVRISSRIS